MSQKHKFPFHMNREGLIVSDDDLTRYNGHYQIDQFHIREGQDENEPEVSTLPNDTDVQSIKEWLRPTNFSEDDVDRWKARPALKILMIKTKNEFSRDPKHNPSHRTIPGQTEVKPLPQHHEQMEMVKDIFQHARLPLAALGAYIKAHIIFLNSPSYEVFGDKGVCTGEVSSYFCSGTSWSIAWSYFHQTRHTAAVMFFREGDGECRRDELIQEIRRLKRHIAHPMILAFTKTQISLLWTFHLLEQMNGQSLEIEKNVRLATWDWVLDREIQAYNDPKLDPNNEYDIAKAQQNAVERYYVLVGKLINIRFRFRCFGEQMKWLRRMNDVYLSSLKGGKCLEARKRECAELNVMLDRLDHLRKVHLHDAETLYDRLRQQMQSLFFLVNQRDSRISLAIAEINNELAWHGKNTNSAMLAIAIISAIFLPSTFIASVFDAPIFDFASTENSSIIARPFWIFWTTCGATTLALCLLLVLFMKVRNLAAKDRRREARQKFRQKIMRAPTLLMKSKGTLEAVEDGPSFRKWLQSWSGRIKGVDEEHGMGMHKVVSLEMAPIL